MVVAMPMIEAAAQTTIVEVLDFLKARCEVACVTEEVMIAAIQGFKPGEGLDTPFIDVRHDRTHMIETLLSQAEDLTLSIPTLELAVRNLEEITAERLLNLSSDNISKVLTLSMVDMKWQPERIHRILCSSAEGWKYSDDQEVIEQFLQTEHGRSFLIFAKPSGSNICTLIEEKLFETAPKNPTSMDCSILDYLHRATEIYLNDEAFAHHWHQDTMDRFISKQVLLHVLELGASGRIGATSFGNFWTTSMDRMSHRCPPLKSLPRIISQLPSLRVDITEELISSAKHGSNGRTALDYVLGPDHDITIHQSALQKRARLGEELWLHRLLSRMSAEEIAALDRDVLLEAAREGGNLSIIKFCRSLARKPSRVALRQKSARELLRLAHYIMRQRF